MQPPTPLTIGVPCRDEGQDISIFATGLARALDSLSQNVPREVIIVVNGSSAAFTKRLNVMLASHSLANHQLRIIESPQGKLAAQRAILERRMLQGYIGFVDSDVIVEPKVLHLLWQRMESDPGCMIAYGQPVPVFPHQLNPLHRLMRVHYALRERAYQRRYFHGRAFLMREWFWDDPQPALDCSLKVSKRLNLDRGPLVDDIALSRMAVARWGTQAIQEVQEANVHFDPPDTLRGIYAAHLRAVLEIERLDHLYPQHAYLQKQVFARAWRQKTLTQFSWRMRTLHHAYRTLESSIKTLAKCHVALIKRGVLASKTTWIRVPGTKMFARQPRLCQNL
jgi:hypothetical protein